MRALEFDEKKTCNQILNKKRSDIVVKLSGGYSDYNLLNNVFLVKV